MTRIEKWKKIKGYEKLYEISSFGRVKSLPRVSLLPNGGKRYYPVIIRKNGKNIWGYENVDLYKNGVGKMITIHRLVAIAFIPNPDNNPQVNHKDGVKTNNNVNNLEWVTRSENQLHAFKTFRKKLYGEDSSNNKLKEVEVLKVYEMLKDGKSQEEIANIFNVGQSLISLIANGKRWSHIFNKHNNI